MAKKKRKKNKNQNHKAKNQHKKSQQKQNRSQKHNQKQTHNQKQAHVQCEKQVQEAKPIAVEPVVVDEPQITELDKAKIEDLSDAIVEEVEVQEPIEVQDSVTIYETEVEEESSKGTGETIDASEPVSDNEEVKTSVSLNKDFAIKVGFILILIVFLVMIYSANNARNVDLKGIETSLLKEEGLSKEMSEASDRDLTRFIGLNPEDYKQVIYYRNTKELAVEELLIVKVASKDQLDGIAEAVESRVDDEIDVYSSYGPKQVAQLESAVMREKGNYYFYCTSDKAEKYEEVFMNAVQ